ncbi:hypothetical protein C1I98_10780 [Spongiactinospora gelatinilytica]|uniref:RING-type domain-containing protein n=1 Tax=Spongiactinospora gelatinilytica TaxID=2666298 RepID=A0A2W2HKT6_9ACTN|nr:hypothetical protein [Spongiactinospora gelatinilytica]PZG50358.1 hypothetical protein C1I98_10780 [Spongiactinospora gelatinilytica]
MSCDHLICARCAGPVAEGRCPQCRAIRDDLHGRGPGGIPPALIVAALIALLIFSLGLRELVLG